MSFKNMKRLTLLICLWCCIGGIQAAEWVDVTRQYMTNPNYAGNSKSGWTISTSYKEDTQYSCQEFFNSTFNMYQTLSVPNGRYRISVQGFYRNGSPSADNMSGTLTSYMYANTTQILMKSIYTETTNYGFPGTYAISYSPYRVVPNSMEGASYYFANGKYMNSMEVLVSDGTLKIGVKNDTWVQNNWCILTNWKLESYTTIAQPTSQNIIINEIESSNIDQTIDPSGNYGGWVELYNPSNEAVNLGGIIVKDHKDRSYKLPANYGFIPANSFKNIWFDHCDRYNGYTQVPFKLDIKGGTISICNASGTVLAQQTYPAAVHRVSYARTADAGNTWSQTGTPSPEASNVGSAWGTEQLAAPEVNTNGCFFTTNVSFSVAVPAGATLVYTTNGSTPVKNQSQSSSYTNSYSTSINRSFTVSSSSIYRFRLYQDGKLPSEVVTRSFLKKTANYVAPVVSVVANNADLMGSDYGVYVKGNGKGRPGRGQSTPCNWNMDWERAVNFEYMVPDENGQYSSVVLNQEVDFEMCGGWSRAWEPHSFKLKANKAYGESNLDYPFFDSKPFIRNKSLQLRNGGNDSYTGCRFKDAAIQEVIRRSGLYVDGQAWQPVHVFINGVYKHVLNMREPNNRHNAFSNYGIDTDFVDQFEMSPDSGYIQMSGTKDAFNQWLELSADCADDEVYQFICDSLVDIDEYINYMAVMFYLGGDDWPQNNVKGFRALQDDENGHPVGKFHFVVFDCDACFNTNNPFGVFNSKEYRSNDLLYGIDENGVDFTGRQLYLPIEFVTIFKNMLYNEQFKKQFADAFCIIAGSVFDPERCVSLVRELQAIENRSLALDNTSCDNTANTLVGNFGRDRQTAMFNAVKNHLGLTDGRQISLSANISGAALLVNGQEVPTGSFSGTLYGDVKVQALAPAGYRFAGWSNSGASGYEEVLPKGSYWKYYCSGNINNSQWYKSFPSSTQGKAPLAYGNNTHSTTLTGNLPTYYFSTQVTLNADQLVGGDLLLGYIADDGFIVYVNGTEAGRYNMPSGSVTYNTLATTYAQNNPDTGEMYLSKNLFHAGNNTISVEVHNNSTSSTDIYWDASLSCQSFSTSNDYVSVDSIYTIGNSAMSLVAMFEPLANDGQRAAAFDFPIKVNEVGAANDVYVNEYWKKNDWIELYNNTDMDLDVAGLYVSDNETKLTKYQIASASFMDNTIIPARGKMVLWADKLEAETQLHTGFKLANEEGAMVLVSSSEEFEANNAAYFAAHPAMKGFTDVLVYGVHEYNESVGRYPDGGKAIYRMCWPSIGKENRHITQNELIGYDEGYQDPTDIAEIPVDDVVTDFEQLTERGEVFYDLQGRRVAHPQPGQLILRRKSPQK